MVGKVSREAEHIQTHGLLNDKDSLFDLQDIFGVVQPQSVPLKRVCCATHLTVDLSLLRFFFGGINTNILNRQRSKVYIPVDLFHPLQVNSDVVFLKRDRYGNLSPFRVDKTHIGQAIYTKAIGSSSPMDITNTYKYPEGNTHTHTQIHTQV